MLTSDACMQTVHRWNAELNATEAFNTTIAKAMPTELRLDHSYSKVK